MEAGAAGFKEARRELDSLLAPAERRVLRWLAERTPRWISSDHLTMLGLAAMMLGGLAWSSVMSAWVAVALLVAYFMLSVNIYLVTYAAGVFKISYGIFGGTELRILLIAANVCVFFAPTIQVGGSEAYEARCRRCHRVPREDEDQTALL